MSTHSTKSTGSGAVAPSLSRANSNRRKSGARISLQMANIGVGTPGSKRGSGYFAGVGTSSPLASPSRAAFPNQTLAPSSTVTPPNTAVHVPSSTSSSASPRPKSGLGGSAGLSLSSTTPRKLHIVRDYAFHRDDSRFDGRGTDVPRPNRLKVAVRRLVGPFIPGGGAGQAFTVDEEGLVQLGAESDKRKRKREKEKESKKGSKDLSSPKGKGRLSRLSWGGWSDHGDGDGYESDDSDDWEEEDGEGGTLRGKKGTSGAEGDWGAEQSSWDILKRLSTWKGGFGNNGAGAGVGGMKPNGTVPSHKDLERNFGGDQEDDDDDEDGEGTYHDAVDYQEGEEQGEYGEDVEYEPEGDEEDEVEEPLYPGLYRAAYAFEPEGTAEMRLVEDQIVRVVGRGGGVGWAVVVCEDEDDLGEEMEGENEKEGEGGEGKKENGKEGGEAGEKKVRHALVPESYLEVVKLDGEVEDERDAGVAVAA